jgi:hypothetical protein
VNFGQGEHVLEPTCKSWPLAQKVQGRTKKIQKKRGKPTLSRHQSAAGGDLVAAGRLDPDHVVGPRPAGDQWSPTSRRSTPRQGRPAPVFFKFFNFFEASSYTLVKFLLEVWGMGQGLGAQNTHFFKLPPSLVSVKSSIPHWVWRFFFFFNFIFPKFRVHMDLHIYHLDFCFMEN